MVPLAILPHKTFHPAIDQTIVAEIRRAVIQQKIKNKKREKKKRNCRLCGLQFFSERIKCSCYTTQIESR